MNMSEAKPLFTKEWLMKKIAEDPDNLSCEAGIMHPEAPRFFIDHSVIHDKFTGKHVRTDEFEEGIEGALSLLNSMHAAMVEFTHTQYRLTAALREISQNLFDGFVVCDKCHGEISTRGMDAEIIAVAALKRDANDEHGD